MPRILGSGAVGLAGVLLCVFLASGPRLAQGATPPAKQTYFTLLLGFEDPYETEAECLQFKGSKICTADRLCGSWKRTGDETFDLHFTIEEEGGSVDVEGSARFEDEGEQSSIAGTARLRFGGRVANFGLTGRAVKKKTCAKLMRRWNIDITPNQPFQDGDCLLRANDIGFGAPEDSEYVLPFAPGTEYNLSQTYCYLFSTHRYELAYDFDIPLGGEIVAARAGEVIAVVENLASDNPWPDANYLKVRHADGSVASYIHVMQDSVGPAVGDTVGQGEVIAQSAMSGTIDAHLHFVVFQGDPPVEGQDLPVNFSNCDGPIDGLGGLIQDQTYHAQRP